MPKVVHETEYMIRIHWISKLINIVFPVVDFVNSYITCCMATVTKWLRVRFDFVLLRELNCYRFCTMSRTELKSGRLFNQKVILYSLEAHKVCCITATSYIVIWCFRRVVTEKQQVLRVESMDELSKLAGNFCSSNSFTSYHAVKHQAVIEILRIPKLYKRK